MDHFRAGIPLYIQIADSLAEQIEAGELAPGDRLPAERELSDQLAVTRMTLRQALHLLQGQGLLVRKHGVGTFVADPKIERQADRLVPFTKGMQSRGLSAGARVILFETRVAGLSTAKALQLSLSAPIYYIVRLRLANQEPSMLEKLSLPAQRFAGFERHDLAARSVYEILSSEYGVEVSRAEQSLEAAPATSYEADLLQVSPGAPLMLERRVGFDQAGQPVETAKDLYRGDRFRFVTEIALPTK
ncbi:MAG: GntR family transcriptional regulator [Caldilineaceae bacterium]|nr:GntR family transcriptional regulator [Caldilineaceae bacterium]